MDSAVFTIGLPAALAVIMFGLGLSLTVQDFVRVATVPRAAVISLACQTVVLPLLCLGLVHALGLAPELAVGMMLLAASPGGTTANLYSHVAGGDVALNISLTAVNSVLAIVTLPVVVNLSVAHFMGDDAGLGLQPGKMLQVCALVLLPVALGMLLRRRRPVATEKLRRPVKRASIAVLAGVVAAAMVQGWDSARDHLLLIGSATLLLCVMSLAVGYGVPKLLGISRAQSIASAMEIGIHNSALAITVAVTLLDNATIAVPPALYGVLMNVPAACAAYLFARRATRRDPHPATT
ncbi:bile acid:sodium symporter family protein [Streptomyces sp. TRM 70351]|uniref:bile acid:sodium symporter family protein n=1 Tax=Streptomyces sp. TRM 70351 TaxID=3116552 RepID=UPI002E7AE5D5|nr:bile acid:sodium symporter family protein [Streptomyces sp. TRM 70351]MEE1929715.1 bile acid:sodium symporter family protein [Streptomyces sp. TRM 70351]